MRLLDRYLLRELLIWLGVCVLFFVVFWATLDLFQQLNKLLDLGLKTGDIARYYAVLAPKFLVIALPVGLLLALLYTLTNLARHNEIVAMRAAGISLWRIALPCFAVGLGAGIILLLVNEFWVPDSSDRADDIKYSHNHVNGLKTDRNLLHNFGFTNERDNRRWVIGIFNLTTAEMISPHVFWTTSDGIRRQLFAERAVPTNGTWLFFKVQMFRDSEKTNATPIPVLQTNALFMPEFTETPAIIKTEMKMSSRLHDKVTKETADVPIFEILDYLKIHPNPDPRDSPWLFTQLHGRLAMPGMCLVVVLIALPFSAASGRRNAFVGVASAIFICFGFIILQQIALAIGARGWLPPWLAAWLPNLIFGVAGIVLTARVR